MKIIFIVFIFLSAIKLYGQTLVIENDHLIMWENRDVIETHNQLGVFYFIQVDGLSNDFSAFENVLGKHNVDFMNRSSSALITQGIGGTYNKWLAKLSFGLSFDNDFRNDSLTVRLNTTRYGVTFGYNLIDNRRFIVTPKTSINWNRYRLINSTKERVLLDEYVHNRDLDIRFNQLTGFVGLNISYKFYFHSVLPSDYWTVGLYGGYIFQFNERPWTYSVDKRLINNNKIDLMNFTIGLRFAWHF